MKVFIWYYFDATEITGNTVCLWQMNNVQSVEGCDATMFHIGTAVWIIKKPYPELNRIYKIGKLFELMNYYTGRGFSLHRSLHRKSTKEIRECQIK